MPLERHMVQGQSQTADIVRSIATFAGKLPNLIQLMPVSGVTALNFKVTWAKVKVKGFFKKVCLLNNLFDGKLSDKY